MATEFEELKLSVVLVDEASSKLEDLKKDFDQVSSGKHVEQIQSLQRTFRELRPIVGGFGAEFSKVNQVLSLLSSRGGLAMTGIAGLGAGMAAGAVGLEKLSTNLNELRTLSTMTGIGMAQIRNIETALRQTGRIPHEKFGQVVRSVANISDQIMRHGKDFYARMMEAAGANREAMGQYLAEIEAKLRAGEKGAAQTMILNLPRNVLQRAVARGEDREKAAGDMRRMLAMMDLPPELAEGIGDITNATKEQEEAMKRLTDQTGKFADTMGRIHVAAIGIKDEFGAILANTFLPTMISGLTILADALNSIADLMKRIRDEGLFNVMGAGQPVPTGPINPEFDEEQRRTLEDYRRGRGAPPRPGGAVMPQRLTGGGVAGFTGPYEPMRTWGAAADWAEQLHGEPSTNIERRDLMEKQNDQSRDLVESMKRTNRLLSGQEPLGLLSTQMGVFGPAGRVGPYGRFAPGGGRAGAPGGFPTSGDGAPPRGGDGGAPSRAPKYTPKPGDVVTPAPGGGTFITTPETPPPVSFAGVPSLAGTPGGPAPGAPETPGQPLPRVGLPGSPSGPAVRHAPPNQWEPGGAARLSDEKGRPVDLETAGMAERLGRAGDVQGLERLFAARGYHMSGPACGIVATKYARAAGFAGPKDSPVATRWHEFGQGMKAEDINAPNRPFGSMFATYYHRRYGGDPSQLLAPGQLGGHVMTIVPGTYNAKAGTIGVVDQYGFHTRNIKDMDLRYAGDEAVRKVREAQGAPSTPAAADSAAKQATGDWSDLHSDVRRWEGFHGSTYADVGGYSIGYGTAGRPGQTITEPAARKAMEEALQQDRREIEKINPNLSEGSKKALSSLLFNLGGDVRKLHAHGMYKAIVAGDVEAMKRAHTEFSHIHGPQGPVLPGLLRRRQEEVKYYDQPAAATTAAPTVADTGPQANLIDLGAARARAARALGDEGAAARAEVDRETIDRLAARRRAHRAIGSANIDVNVKDHTTGHTNVAQIGPFRKVRTERMAQMTAADSGPERHVAEAGSSANAEE
jgi:GH24 family phage-related lysozyme (muramidase)